MPRRNVERRERYGRGSFTRTGAALVQVLMQPERYAELKSRADAEGKTVSHLANELIGAGLRAIRLEDDVQRSDRRFQPKLS